MTQLETYIAETGTTQAAIADAIGVSRGYMSQITGGTRVPRLEIAAAIERHTNGAVTAVSLVQQLHIQSGPPVAAERTTAGVVPATSRIPDHEQNGAGPDAEDAA